MTMMRSAARWSGGACAAPRPTLRRFRRERSRRRLALVASALVAGGLLIGCGDAADRTPGGPVAMRRLTEAQYRQTIADLFGDDIEVVGRFEPDVRQEGLLAVGASEVTITPVGFEQYEAIARTIAAQVVSTERRDEFVPCRPAAVEAPDAACTAAFVESVGSALLRRPLDEEDVRPRVEIARAAAAQFGDFYVGLEYALASLLLSPEFLFRVESVSPEGQEADRWRLSDASLAQRLSFFLWNTAPDEELLAAAERGELADDEGLARQVDRLIASDRLEAGVRAYFADILRFDEFEDVGKDASLYPKYSRALLEDAQEQTLRVVGDHLVTRRGDFRDLFTTRESFMTRTLGMVYGVPVRAREGWEGMTFPEGHPRSGILSHVSTLALHSHPGRTSATLRGLFIREAILCQEVPPAPADVDFSVVQDTENTEHRTARDRLEAHRTEPSCSGCHARMDPLGLALEQFDGIGEYRRAENGEPIDASGDLDGVSFSDAADFGRAIRNEPATVSCLVENLYKYAVGHAPGDAEVRFLRGLEERFGEAGYRFPDLMAMIAMSEPFRTVARPTAESEGAGT